MSTQDTESDDKDGETRDDRDPSSFDLDGDGDGADSFADDEFDDDPETTEVTPASGDGADTDSTDGAAASPADTAGGGTASDAESGGGFGSIDDIPHRIRADSPQDGRESITVFVADEDKRRLQELQQLSEREFDKRVYKIDVYLAALRGGLDSDERFLSEMQEIGYGLGD